MIEKLFEKHLAEITEIRNILDSADFDFVDHISSQWTINDSIVHEYEKATECISILKVQKYNKLKQNTKMKVYTEMKQNLKNAEFIDTFNTEQNICKNNINSSKVNASFEKILTEDEIKSCVDRYNQYCQDAQNYLKNVNYFNFWRNTCSICVEDILTNHSYNNYLQKLIKDNLLPLAKKVSAERFTQQSSLLYHKNYASFISNSITLSDVHFIPESYIHVNKTEKNIQYEHFYYLTKQLFYLCNNISNTQNYANTIFDNYVKSTLLEITFTKFRDEMHKECDDYLKKRSRKKEPENWKDWLKSFLFQLT